MRRNVSGFPLFFFCIYYFSFALTKAAFLYAIKRQKNYLIALKNAVLWHFSNKIRQPAKDALPRVVATT